MASVSFPFACDFRLGKTARQVGGAADEGHLHESGCDMLVGLLDVNGLLAFAMRLIGNRRPMNVVVGQFDF